MEGETTVNIAETLGSALGEVAGDVMSGIGTILPVALGIMGGILVITVGVKLFKRFSK